MKKAILDLLVRITLVLIFVYLFVIKSPGMADKYFTTMMLIWGGMWIAFGVDEVIEVGEK